MKRRVFYSFHYDRDSWRAALVRNIGALDGNKPATDNDWETVKKGGDLAIKRWIAGQMQGRTCCVVLVGSKTAKREWVDHEIKEAWRTGMGVVGIRIHGLEDSNKRTSPRGSNPFDHLFLQDRNKVLSSAQLMEYLFVKASDIRLSSIVKCHDPQGRNSSERYNWIADHLANAVEEAIQIRNVRNGQ